MKPIHRTLSHHIRERLNHATKPKFVVTAGITCAALCEVAGLHGAALGMSIFTNLIWIWE